MIRASREAARHQIPLVATLSDLYDGVLVHLHHYDYDQLSGIEERYLAQILIEACERSRVEFQPTLDTLTIRLLNPRPKPLRTLGTGRGFEIPSSY